MGRPSWGWGRLWGRGRQRAEVLGLRPGGCPVALEWGQWGGDVATGELAAASPVSFEGCYGRIQPRARFGGGAESREGIAGVMAAP